LIPLAHAEMIRRQREGSVPPDRVLTDGVVDPTVTDVRLDPNKLTPRQARSALNKAMSMASQRPLWHATGNPISGPECLRAAMQHELAPHTCAWVGLNFHHRNWLTIEAPTDAANWQVPWPHPPGRPDLPWVDPARMPPPIKRKSWFYRELASWIGLAALIGVPVELAWIAFTVTAYGHGDKGWALLMVVIFVSWVWLVVHMMRASDGTTGKQKRLQGQWIEFIDRVDAGHEDTRRVVMNEAPLSTAVATTT
jgi:hypothetical protein